VPPLTTEAASALVAGGDARATQETGMQPQKPAQPETLKVHVLRSFQDHQRKVLEKGVTATLPRLFALEMKAANKVEFVEDAPAPAPTPPAKEEKSLFGGGRKEK
jgi:hypothetical protein